MKHSFLLRVLTVLIILPLFFSCKKGNNEAHTFYGPSVTMGNGIGRSIVEVGADGKPLSIGVELTKDALQNLPAESSSETVDYVEYALLFDSKIQPLLESLTPFKHLILNWEPHGHPPIGAY